LCELTPLSVDRGRILVDTGGGELQVLGRAGRPLRRFWVGDHELGAVLEGRNLIVGTTRDLRVYDASTGRLRRAVPLRVAAGARLADVESGLAAVVSGVDVYVVRFDDGRTIHRRVPGRGPARAQLTEAGLFTASRVAGARPGRVAFTPIERLVRALD
jgi:hypothetical protein